MVGNIWTRGGGGAMCLLFEYIYVEIISLGQFSYMYLLCTSVIIFLA